VEEKIVSLLSSQGSLVPDSMPFITVGGPTQRCMERYVCSGTLRRGSLQLFVIYSFPCFRDVGVCAHPQAEVSDLQDIYRQNIFVS
jgi:hypothetical protein